MLDEQIDNYLCILKRSYKSQTFNIYKSSILKFRQFLKIYKIDSLKLDDIRIEFKKYLENNNQSIASIYLIFIALNNFLIYLKKEQVISFDPNEIFSDELMRKYYEDQKKIKSNILTEIDMDELLHFWDRYCFKPIGLRNKIIITLLFEYGLKTSEISKISLNDIDFASSKLKIGNSANSRFLKLESNLVDLIKKYLEIRNSVADKLIINFSNSINNKSLTARSIQRITNATATKSGLMKKITPKDFRFTKAYNWIMEGHSMLSVAKDLGQKSITFSKRILTTEKAKEALRKEGYMTTVEAMKVLGYSNSALIKICRKNTEFSLKIKGDWFIKESFIAEYKERILSTEKAQEAVGKEGYITIGEARKIIGHKTNDTLGEICRKNTAISLKVAGIWFIKRSFIKDYRKRNISIKQT